METVASQDNPNAAYDSKYDAYYDSVTNEWLEKTCSDATCEFCSKRPPKHVSSPQ